MEPYRKSKKTNQNTEESMLRLWPASVDQVITSDRKEEIKKLHSSEEELSQHSGRQTN